MNTTEITSIVMNPSWSWGGRIALVAVMCCVGALINAVGMAAVLTRGIMRQTENILLASLFAIDMTVSLIAFPLTMVALLGTNGSYDFTCCKVQWFVVVLYVLATVPTHMAIAIENYHRLYRIGRPVEYHSCWITPCGLACIELMICCVSIVSTCLMMTHGVDFCTRTSQGNPLIQMAIGTGVLLVPCVVGAFYHYHGRALARELSVVGACTRACATERASRVQLANALNFFVTLTTLAPLVCAIAVRAPTALVDGAYWLALARCCGAAFACASASGDFRQCLGRLYARATRQQSEDGALERWARAQAELVAAAAVRRRLRLQARLAIDCNHTTPSVI